MTHSLLTGIVRILNKNGQSVGTGFLLPVEGLIATCAHVVGSAGAGAGDTVNFVFQAANHQATALVEPEFWRDPNQEDVALLRFEEPLPAKSHPLPLGAAANSYGHAFETYGFPQSNPNDGLWGKGEILAQTKLEGIRVLQLESTQVTSGFSGGPVWDKENKCVVGMNTIIAQADRYGRQGETGFATPIEVLKEVCPHLPINATAFNIERLPYEPETVFIPDGPFLMGSNDGPDNEKPQHSVELPAYRIGKYPVSNAQFSEFLQRETAWDGLRDLLKQTPFRAWRRRKPPKKEENYPVVSINWYDALAYCRWLSRLTNRHYRLPTEAEWEKAARGTQGQLYPWGNTWEDGYPNKAHNLITPVSILDTEKNEQPYQPNTASPYQCYDMIGNIEEWCNTFWGSNKSDTETPYPYHVSDGREDINTDEQNPGIYCVYRGGLAINPTQALRCSTRNGANALQATKYRGFRVVLVLP